MDYARLTPPEEIGRLFETARAITYLDTATYGLPPTQTTEVLHAVLDAWHRGEFDWPQAEREADHARTLFAQLIGAPSQCVALLPSASAAATLIAQTATRGEIALCPDDHSSVTLPVVAIARERGIRIRRASFSNFSEAITPETRLVAISHVHYATGAVADTERIRMAAATVGAGTYLDVTQSAGVLPLAAATLGFDYLSCAAYKWLCCPRGTAFLYVSPDRIDALRPLAPSRRSTTRPLIASALDQTVFATNAAKLDFSLAWFSWIGARNSLETLLRLDEHTRRNLSIGHAQYFAELVGLEPPESAIIRVPVTDVAQATQTLASARIAASVREQSVRIAPYVYNTRVELERAATVLERLVDRGAVS